MTYKIYAFCYVAWHSSLLAQGKDWLAQYQHNMTGLEIGSWFEWFGLLAGQHYEGPTSTRTRITCDVASVHNSNNSTIYIQ